MVCPSTSGGFCSLSLARRGVCMRIYACTHIADPLAYIMHDGWWCCQHHRRKNQRHHQRRRHILHTSCLKKPPYKNMQTQKSHIRFADFIIAVHATTTSGKHNTPSSSSDTLEWHVCIVVCCSRKRVAFWRYSHRTQSGHMHCPKPCTPNTLHAMHTHTTKALQLIRENVSTVSTVHTWNRVSPTRLQFVRT